jgi:hypothetical protein
MFYSLFDNFWLPFFFFSTLTHNDRGYGHPPLHGMFHLREHSLSQSDKVEAGAKLPEFTSASQ